MFKSLFIILFIIILQNLIVPSDEDDANIQLGSSRIYKIKSVWHVGICNIILKSLSLLYILIVLSPEHEHKFPDFSFIKQLHHFWWAFITRMQLNSPFLLIMSFSAISSGIYE